MARWVVVDDEEFKKNGLEPLRADEPFFMFKIDESYGHIYNSFEGWSSRNDIRTVSVDGPKGMRRLAFQLLRVADYLETRYLEPFKDV